MHIANLRYPVILNRRQKPTVNYTQTREKENIMSGNVSTLLTMFKNAPDEDGDDKIKKELVQVVGNANQMDELIQNLSKEYDLNQIFKVYYKNFA